jgi:hypothetical protein
MGSHPGLSQTPISNAARWVGYRWYVFLPLSLAVMLWSCVAFVGLERVIYQLVETSGIAQLSAIAVISIWGIVAIAAGLLSVVAFVGFVDRLVASARKHRALRRGI